ncbi:PREDICTED: actin-binding protein anillin-like isoform X2 [Poecilia mexicana]|uniref:PH domain-containing protein n=2 Tax=Poecilia mexicana TaxID=48701 RepID=A0A3B3X6B2_9TELE|nr:PREDICTED: actin-binding protein anillin-like isoform X2 [Poecilia mexicana]
MSFSSGLCRAQRLLFIMEAGQENGSNVTLKRPLSDTEDNNVPAADVKDGLKRRRLEAAGQENRSPEPSSSGRLAEFQAKPDTPVIPSVRSRVQLLAQRKDGFFAQRSFSHPGNEGPSVSSKGVGEHLLGEEEFHQRLERFKAPASQADTTQTPSPASSCLRPRSGFVSGIQQKLQCTTTPSSKQASIIRQERELELNQLPFQPISKNAWLKRCSSDSSITQGGPPAGCSSPSSWVPVSKRTFCWPPIQPWDVPGDVEMKDGSFTEMLTSVATTPSENMAGEGAVADAPAAFKELKLSSEEEKESVPHGEEAGNENELKPATVNAEEQPRSQHPESQTVLKFSFSDEHSLSDLHTADKHSFLQSTLLDESNTKETSEVSRVTEVERSEVFPFDEDETMEGSTCGEEIEPSTDEELREWRYPQGNVSADEEERVFSEENEEEMEAAREGKEKESSLRNKSEPADDRSAPDLDVSEKSAGFSEQQEDEKLRAEEKRSDGENRVDDSLIRKSALKVKTLREKPSETNFENETQPGGRDECQGSSEIQMSDSHQGERAVLGGLKAESSKKVTFILEPELINGSALSEGDASEESRADTSLSDSGSGSHDDTNSTETIEKMFEEVLEYAGSAEEEGRVEEDGEDHDSGIGSCSVGKTGEKIERQEEPRGEERDENEELLTFPQSGILSPLSKSFEAVVTPLRLAAAQESHPPPLPLSPEESSTPPQSAPLYSIDAYRTQRQRKLPAIQSVTPVVQRRTPETPKPKESNTKEKITALNEEAGKLQLVINQTLQALSCCTDVEHGRGSLEEAEAEKLLLVSCEKRSALLAEVSRLREERSLQTDEAPKEDTDYVSQHACRGTVNITSIQLPLKVEFVCSSNSRPGRPSHYFFVLIRYGPCNVIATPLATAADAQNGDTISFPTAVTLKDIRSSFEIDVEVYSLCTSSGSSSTSDRTSTKSRVTPRKFLNTLTKSSNIFTSPAALNTRRSSNFSLVGSHKITLASLGCRKFPLDKMKLDGKIRKLLGDEFQEKVPFLSPLEGHIYLKLDSEGHSDVQHQGFLTMFELISGFGVWNRRYFVLEECNLSYWSNPNDRETKEAEGSISLSRSPSQCVRPVKRDSCARPFTFELVNASQQEDQNQEALSKCWFSADTKQERLDWMEKLNQALLDFHTWNRPPAENQASNMSNTSHLSNTSHSGTLTESIL